jgi:tRNA threonylcarbamoyladenosine biosynthesis protein TsaB
MLLLAIDTSGKNGSIALATIAHSHTRVEVIEVVPLDGGAFSAQLVPQIAHLLEKHGRSKNDLCGFAVVSGPGSFTGLRVGLAAIKALAEVLKQPIAAISLLEAVARGSASRGCLLAALDAGRREVYVGDYEIDSGNPATVSIHSERLLSWERFLAEARGAKSNSKAIVTPDSMLAEALRNDGIQVELIEYPNGGVIARLGWERLQRGETVLPEELRADYLGHSDAEIFSRPPR